MPHVLVDESFAKWRQAKWGQASASLRRRAKWSQVGSGLCLSSKESQVEPSGVRPLPLFEEAEPHLRIRISGVRPLLLFHGSGVRPQFLVGRIATLHGVSKRPDTSSEWKHPRSI